MPTSYDLPQLNKYSNGFVGVNITGLTETVEALTKLYPEAADAAVESANQYILDTLKGPDGYAPYQYVSWAQIGGFVSDRQRRYVMAALASGEIPTPGSPNRTNRMRDAWMTQGSGREQTVTNETPDAVYTMSPTSQFRMHEVQGWPTVPAWLAAHANDIRGAFSDGIQKLLAKSMTELASVAP